MELSTVLHCTYSIVDLMQCGAVVKGGKKKKKNMNERRWIKRKGNSKTKREKIRMINIRGEGAKCVALTAPGPRDCTNKCRTNKWGTSGIQTSRFTISVLPRLLQSAHFSSGFCLHV
jgi:hypothetical protein